MSNLQDRVCRTCDRAFKGGPRAYYCPSCRVERQREAWRKHQRRKKKGDIRPLGSIDKCERCGKDYIVQAGLQRFCPDCQPIHAAEYDRQTSIEFYHENKDRINPTRNIRRRVKKRKCEFCGKSFDPEGTKRLTCSSECRRLFTNKKWNERYKARKKNPPTD